MKIPEDTYGVMESLIASAIFFSPNFLFFVGVPEWTLLIYNFSIIMVLVSNICNMKFSTGKWK